MLWCPVVLLWCPLQSRKQHYIFFIKVSLATGNLLCPFKNRIQCLEQILWTLNANIVSGAHSENGPLTTDGAKLVKSDKTNKLI